MPDGKKTQLDRENERRAFAGLPPRMAEAKGAVTHETTPELQHFLSLVKLEYTDEHSTAAYTLAGVVLENVSCLDEKALRGLVTFIGIAKVDFSRARELLED